MNSGMRFRIYPDEKQAEYFNNCFGCSRYVYNHFLEEWYLAEYTGEGYPCTYNRCSKELTALKKENPWLSEVDSTALQQTLRHLFTAVRNVKAGRAKKLRFKSAKHHEQRYTSQNNNDSIRIENGMLRLPRAGSVRISLHRDIPEGWRILSATVTLRASGRYYVSLCLEYDLEIEERPVCNMTGLDFSMPSLYVSDIGERPVFDRQFRKYERILAREQRRLSRVQKGSRNYEKQRIRIARLHEKIAAKRNDFLHKASASLSDRYDTIFIEDLNMRNMSRALNFGKSVHDVSWGRFVEMLEYKSERKGGRVIRVDRYYPSSKTCSHCGYIKKDLSLSDRTWTCPECGRIHDRDENAALNILNEGLRMLAA